MTDNQALTAFEFLQPDDRSFWKWSADGEAIEWLGGGTIVFVSELKSILDKLVETGFPPHDLILVILAASRDNWRPFDQSAEVQIPHTMVSSCLEASGIARDLIAKLIDRLNSINQLDHDVRLSTDAKFTLIEFCCSGIKSRYSAEQSRQILEFLECGPDEWEQDLARYKFSPHKNINLASTLHQFLNAVEGINSERIRQYRDTGLEELPTKIPEALDLPFAQRVKSLLNLLKDDPEYSGLVQAAVQLSSVIALPRPLSEPEELAEGGVSDICNRGSLDRLLLSELANDDLTLSVRIAMNEALYLRRETPPSDESFRRTVVIDSGLQMWGVPRVIAISTALAIAADSRVNCQFDCVIPGSKLLESIDLSTRVGVSRAMELLSPTADLYKALVELDPKLELESESGELVVITSERGSQRQAFKTALAQLPVETKYIATTNRSGKIEIFEHHRAGKKLLKSVEVDLDQIVNSKPILKPNVDRELPAIFFVDPFPLFMPAPPRVEFEWSLGDDGFVTTTGDHRVLWFYSDKRGGRQLSTTMKPGKVLWQSPEAYDSCWEAVIGTPGERMFSRLKLDLQNRCISKSTISSSKSIKGFFHHRRHLFARLDNSIGLVDQNGCINDERLVHSDQLVYQDRRFFRNSHNQWFVVSAENEQPVIREIKTTLKIKALLEHVDFPEIICLDQNNRGYLLDSKDILLELGLSEEFGNYMGSSYNGDLIRFARPNTSFRQFLFSIKDGELKAVPQSTMPFQQYLHGPFRSNHTIRNRFNDLEITEDGKLILVSPKTKLLVEYSNRQIHLSKTDSKSSPNPIAASFQQLPKSAEYHFKLQQAVFKGGSKVWLDSRGLMHFKSSDPAIPEFTMVLTEGFGAGWCADGRLWGNPYYTADENSRIEDQIYDQLISGFCKQIVDEC